MTTSVLRHPPCIPGTPCCWCRARIATSRCSTTRRVPHRSRRRFQSCWVSAAAPLCLARAHLPGWMGAWRQLFERIRDYEIDRANLRALHSATSAASPTSRSAVTRLALHAEIRPTPPAGRRSSPAPPLHGIGAATATEPPPAASRVASATGRQMRGAGRQIRAEGGETVRCRWTSPTPRLGEAVRPPGRAGNSATSVLVAGRR